MKYTLEDCTEALNNHRIGIIETTYQITGLDVGEWILLSESQDSKKPLVREFANTATPVVISLIETNNNLKIYHQKPCFPWEMHFEKYFRRWFYEDMTEEIEENWYYKLIWDYVLPSDLWFYDECYNNNELSCFFAPKKGPTWNSFIHLNKILANSGLGLKANQISDGLFEFDGYPKKEHGQQLITLLSGMGFEYKPANKNGW